jgi:hypothetical protein
LGRNANRSFCAEFLLVALSTAHLTNRVVPSQASEALFGSSSQIADVPLNGHCLCSSHGEAK